MANDVLPNWTKEAKTGDEVTPTTRSAGANVDWAKDSEAGDAEGQQGGAHVDANPTTTSTGGAAPEHATDEEGAARCCQGFDIREMIRRDGRLLLITIIIIVVMNVPFIKWILYPFSIFSTWIHELCHGFSAILLGGKINKLLLFPDTSGLAYATIPAGTRHKAAFVSTAGYQGTAVVGCLLLLFRRTKRGPRSGMMILAFTMLLSVCIWIRNAFGIAMIILMGIALAAAAWKLPSKWMRSLYVVLCVTVALNSITNVHDLYGANHYVNGLPSTTDAHSMSDNIGGPSWIWATLWLLFSLAMMALGLVFAIPGPDEVADFKCCGVCVDLGLFKMLNKRNERGSGGDSSVTESADHSA